MPNIPKEIEKLREQAYRIYTQSGVLSSILVEENDSSPLLCSELGKLVASLEEATMRARELAEFCYFNTQDMRGLNKYAQLWPGGKIAGKVEVDQYGWLHIKLNTLLPHCKYKANPLLANTITMLLEGYRLSGGKVPFYERAMLVIDEHCNIQNRQVFDQDNKGWKVISNALKGLVVADDDQYSLSVAMTSTWDDIPSCHIYVLNQDDAGAFFEFRTGSCGSYFTR